MSRTGVRLNVAEESGLWLCYSMYEGLSGGKWDFDTGLTTFCKLL